MYPKRELIRLAARKADLQREIGLRRARCAVAMARVAQPVGWLDWTLDFYRRHSPLAQFAAVVLGLFVKRAGSRRVRVGGLLLRWGPLALAAVRAIAGALRSRPGSGRTRDDKARRRRGGGNGMTEAGTSGAGARRDGVRSGPSAVKPSASA